MALGLSDVCGLAQVPVTEGAAAFAKEIGEVDKSNESSEKLRRRNVRHVVFVLCDGMGTAVLKHHLKSAKSFLLQHNQPDRMLAVFPATTPAALTTLATGVWPGRHGAAGWELRDQKKCEYPKQREDPVQITVLHKHLWDMRSNSPIKDFGFADAEKDVFFAKSWSAAGQPALQPQDDSQRPSKRLKEDDSSKSSLQASSRRMLFVNAYLGTDFTDFAQAKKSIEEDRLSICSGCEHATSVKVKGQNVYNLQTIGETAAETLQTPEGPKVALEYFGHGVDAVLNHIRKAEQDTEERVKDGSSHEEEVLTYSYLYTAHPDKHMHPLGVEHESVGQVVRGLDSEIERLWRGIEAICGKGKQGSASLMVTADHGHVTVHPENMVSVPVDVEENLEYACVGVHGKGRHAYFRVKAGLERRFKSAWFSHKHLYDSFLLLKTDEAADAGLFGPECEIEPRARPRLGDFVAISIGKDTLVSPKEVSELREKKIAAGAHGSITPEELRIPFVLLQTPA
eukprot:TRINITY_DN64569_c0_g1_i1.p1 TRINITY_DN64569_c0_g1~~TRINITY_DN64569_c0_g1_i1.p1  ORF type:complete len:527 (-),score=99.94 TRINITY_DN64569_c0_g1_i1:184-1713(-)